MVDILKYSVGIDVASSNLEAGFGFLSKELLSKRGRSRTFANRKSGFKSLDAWITKQRKQTAKLSVIMEATGVYHENLAHYLHSKGYDIYVIVPNKAKSYLLSLGLRAKNDPIDSGGLTQMGLDQQHLEKWSPPSPVMRQLRGLTRHRQSIQQQITAVNNQLHAIKSGFYEYGSVKSSLRRAISFHKKQIREIDEEILFLLDQDVSLKTKIENYRATVNKIPTTTEVFVMLAVAFGAVAIAHWGSDMIVPFMKQFKVSLEAVGLTSLMSGFFWLIVIVTTIGLGLSFTKYRSLEGVGASRWGSVFIYILVATIGMHMNLGDVINNLGLFAIGIIWMLIHVTILLLVAKLIKAPFFFVAVGSQANVGGAASAPIVASAFSPSLAPVGVLMAVLGYALGTYGALICAYMMQAVSGGI